MRQCATTFLLLTDFLCAPALASCGQTVAERDVLAFTASWCGPCQMAKPTLASLKKQGVKICHVDVDTQCDLASQYRIRAVPTFIVRENGCEVQRTNDVQVLVSLREWLCQQ